MKFVSSKSFRLKDKKTLKSFYPLFVTESSQLDLSHAEFSENVAKTEHGEAVLIQEGSNVTCSYCYYHLIKTLFMPRYSRWAISIFMKLHQILSLSFVALIFGVLLKKSQCLNWKKLPWNNTQYRKKESLEMGGDKEIKAIEKTCSCMTKQACSSAMITSMSLSPSIRHFKPISFLAQILSCKNLWMSPSSLTRQINSIIAAEG